MATQENNILIVVNPTAAQQPAIERTALLTKSRTWNPPPDVTVLITTDYSSTENEYDNESTYRDGTWLQELLAPLIKAGITPNLRISWSKSWADGILYTANKIGATHIRLSNPGKNATKTFSDEFWYLVRNSSVPVSVVQSAREPAHRPVLIAMDVLDKEIRDLNLRVLEYGKNAAATFKSDLHFLNAYKDSMNYPDRGKIANRLEIPNECIHLKPGSPAETISAMVKELDPDLVIIGATRRSGLRAALRGKKIADILTRIDHDLLIVV